MPRLLICLLTLLCLGAGLGEKPVDIGGVRPGQTGLELEEARGKPERFQQDLQIYDHGQIMVRLRDDMVVYVAGFDLAQAGRSLQLAGVSVEGVRRALGEPERLYRKGTVETWLYPASNADLGILFQSSVVGGFVLQEPGTLGRTLEAAGYQPALPGQR